MLLLPDTVEPEADGRGVMYGGGKPFPGGAWNGFAPDGTESRRVWTAGLFSHCTWRGAVEIGDCRPEENLPGLSEYVAEAGVLNPFGDWLP